MFDADAFLACEENQTEKREIIAGETFALIRRSALACHGEFESGRSSQTAFSRSAVPDLHGRYETACRMHDYTGLE